jgi:hypothetical protein
MIEETSSVVGAERIAPVRAASDALTSLDTPANEGAPR